MLNKTEIVLGIDPGLLKTGWGLVLKVNNSLRYIDCGVIKTSSKDHMEDRLSLIFDSVSNLISSLKPNEIAMEEVFVNMNPKTSEKLIMARTASFIAISKHGFMVNQYKPNEIKKNVTGIGHASKEQVYKMIQKILGKKVDTNSERTMDSMDALAIAICHSFNNRRLYNTSWGH